MNRFAFLSTMACAICLLAFALPASAQSTPGNIAMTAQAAHGAGGSGVWGADQLNNGDTNGSSNDCWTSANSWIELTWTAPVKIGTMKVWYTRYRSLGSNYCFHRGTIRYYENNTWKTSHVHDDMNYGANDDETITLPNPVVTTKIRIENLYAGSNIMIQEWEVFPPPATEWTGAVSSSWSDENNWSDGLPVPDLGAFIPNAGTTPNDPVLPDAEVTVPAIEIDAGAVLRGGNGRVIVTEKWQNKGGNFIAENSLVTYAGDGDFEVVTAASSIGNVRMSNTMGKIIFKDEFSASNTGNISVDAGVSVYFEFAMNSFSSATIDNQGTFYFGVDGGGTVLALQEITAGGNNLGNVSITVPSAMDEVEFKDDVGFNDATLTGDGNIRFLSSISEITGVFEVAMSGITNVAGEIGSFEVDPANNDIQGELVVSGDGSFNVGQGLSLDTFRHTGAGIVDLGSTSVGITFFQVDTLMEFSALAPIATADVRLTPEAREAKAIFNSGGPVRFNPAATGGGFGVFNEAEFTASGDVAFNTDFSVIGSFRFDSSANLDLNSPFVTFAANDAEIRGDGFIRINGGGFGGQASFSGNTNLSGTTSVIVAPSVFVTLSGHWVDNASGGNAQLNAVAVDDGEIARISTPGRVFEANALGSSSSNSAGATLNIDGHVVLSAGLDVEEGTSTMLMQGAHVDFTNATSPVSMMVEGTLLSEIGPSLPVIDGPANSANHIRFDTAFPNNYGAIPTISFNGIVLRNFGRDNDAFAMRFIANSQILAFNDVRFENVGNVTDAIVLESTSVPSVFNGFYMDGQAAHNINANALSGLRLDVKEAKPVSGNLYGGGFENDDNHVLVWENPPEMAFLTDTTLANALAENPYSAAVDVIGGNLPATYTLLNAPDFLSINAFTGELTGTPTRSDIGKHVFVVIATDVTSPEKFVQDQFNLTVDSLTDVQVTIVTPQKLVTGGVGEPYRYALSAAGGGAGGYTWSLVDPNSLPQGIYLDGNAGEFYGTPSLDAAGVYNIPVRATDPNGNSAIKSFQMTIHTEYSDPGVIAGVLADGPGGGGCAISGSDSSWIFLAFLGLLGLVALRRKEA